MSRSFMTLLNLIAVMSLCSLSFSLHADPIKTRTIKSGTSYDVKYGHQGRGQSERYQSEQYKPKQHQSNYNQRSHSNTRRHARHIYNGSQNSYHNTYKNARKNSYKNISNNGHKNRNSNNYNNNHNNNHSDNYSNNYRRTYKPYSDPNNGLVVIPLAVSAPNTGKIFSLPTRSYQNRYKNSYKNSYKNTFNNSHNNNHRSTHKPHSDPNNGLVVIPLAVSAPNTGKVFYLPRQN